MYAMRHRHMWIPGYLGRHLYWVGCLLIAILQVAHGKTEVSQNAVLFSGYAPQNLTRLSYTTKSIEVGWDSPGNLVNISFYNINWNCNDCNSCNGFYTANNTVRKYNVSGLLPAKECSITVSSVLANTTSYPSQITQYTRPTPPGPGRDVRSTATTILQEVYLSEKPATIEAFYTNAEDNSRGNQSSYHEEFREIVIVRNLVPGSIYKVDLIGVIGNGRSTPSEIEETTKLALAANMSSFNVTEEAISLRWEEVGYNIDYWKVDCSSKSSSVSSVNINRTEAEFADLQPGMCHTFTHTPQSNNEAVYLPEGSSSFNEMTVPLPPVNVTSRSLNESSILVTWQPPPESYSNFVIEYDPPGGQPPSPVVTAKTVTEVVISELAGDSDYNLTIYTRSFDADCGITRNSETQTQEQCTIPYAPGEIVEYNLTENSMLIGWNTTARYPERHEVSLTPAERTMVIGNVTEDGDGEGSFSVEVTGLRPGQRYVVAVQVFSCDGLSQPSQSLIRTVVIPPGPPGNLTAVDVKGHTIDIEWEEPLEPNGDIQFYYVYLFREGATDPELLNTTDTVTRLSISNLTAVTEHLIAVAAVNEEGPGALSNNITVVTDESLPESVTELEVEQDTSTTLNMSWSPPDVSNGIIRQYEVNVTDGTGHFCITVLFSCSNCEPPATIPSPSTTPSTSEPLDVTTDTTSTDSIFMEYDSYEVNNYSTPPDGDSCEVRHAEFRNEQTEFTYQLTQLIPYTNYTVTVTAATSKGFGSSASAVNQTLQDVPGGPPTNIQVTNQTWNSLNISWLPPELPNGIITKYDVHLVEAVSETFINITTLELSVDVTDLLHYEDYIVRISASTVIGNGSWSEPITARTQEGVPTPVRNLTSFSPSSTSVNLTWLSPLLPNGLIRQYVIRYNGTERNVSADRSYDLIGGLEKWAWYTFSVTAQNFAYEGNMTSISQRTQEDTPEMPAALNTTFYNATQICVSWQPPNKANGVLLGYRLQWNSSMEVTTYYLSPDTLDHCEGGLAYWTHYEFRLAANTSKGYGEEAVLIQRTKEYYPGQVASNNITCKTTNDTVTLTWLPPEQPNGFILRYTVTSQQIRKLQDHDDLSAKQQDFTEASGTIQDLYPYREFNFTIFAHTSVGPGVPSQAVYCKTAIGAPKPLGGVLATPQSAFTVNVTWMRPWLKTGPTNYTLTVIDTDDNSVRNTTHISGYEMEQALVQGLDAYWTYRFEVEAVTSAGVSSLANTTTTLEAVPGPVNSFDVQTISQVYTQVNASWKIPDKKLRRGRISEYLITYKGVQADGLGDQTEEQKKIYSVADPDSPPELYSTVLSVVSEFNYSFEITAKTGAGYGDVVKYDKAILVPSGAPPSYNASLGSFASEAADQNEVTDNATQIKVALQRAFFANNLHGQLRRIGLIIAEEVDDLKEDPIFAGSVAEYEKLFEASGKYTSWKVAYSNKFTSAYRLTNDSWSDKKLLEINAQRKRRATSDLLTEIIGRDGDCATVTGTYCNGKLKPSTNYRIRGFSCTQSGCTETPYSNLIKTASSVGGSGPSNPTNNLTAIIAGSVGAGVAVILIVVIVVLIVATRRKSNPRSQSGGQALIKGGGRRGSQEVVVNPTFADEGDEPSSRPIKVSEFVQKVKELQEKNKNFFRDEHSTIQELSPSLPKLASISLYNTPKNRYLNIFAFDHSRVKLSPIEGTEGSDYINANYIPGYNKTQEFIAAQGPNDYTIADFWRMIWEQNISLIVMLTRPIENGKVKCSQYWPDVNKQPTEYENLKVTMTAQESQSSYISRSFTLSQSSGETSDSHTVTQFCFLGWNDFEAPRETRPLLQFVRLMRRQMSNSKGPVLVHCSAGVGRTGTFIVLDTLLQQIQDSDYVDIFGLVLRLREYRNSMVQSVAQYKFIHDCVMEVLQEDKKTAKPDEIHVTMTTANGMDNKTLPDTNKQYLVMSKPS